MYIRYTSSVDINHSLGVYCCYEQHIGEPPGSFPGFRRTQTEPRLTGSGARNGEALFC